MVVYRRYDLSWQDTKDLEALIEMLEVYYQSDDSPGTAMDNNADEEKKVI